MKPDLESELKEWFKDLPVDEERQARRQSQSTLMLAKSEVESRPMMPPSMAEAYTRARAKAVSLYDMDSEGKEGNPEYESLAASLRADLATLREMRGKASGRKRSTEPLTIVVENIRRDFPKPEKPQEPGEPYSEKGPGL